MYKTTKDYKKRIYESVHEMNIYIDGINVCSGLKSIDSQYELFANKKITLGTTPMQIITILLKKSCLPINYKKAYIESGILDGEIVPIGHFDIINVENIDEHTTEIKLYDYMNKLDVPYDGSELGVCTAKVLYIDICNKFGIEPGTTSFIGENDIIYTYDNTMSARQWIGYIATLAGGFAHIGRDGKLYLKPLVSNIRYGEELTLNINNDCFSNIYEILGKCNQNENNNIEVIKNNINFTIKRKIKTENLLDEIYALYENGDLILNVPDTIANKVDFNILDNGKLSVDIAEALNNKVSFSINEKGKLIIEILEEYIELEEQTIIVDLGDFELYSINNVYDKFLYQDGIWYLYKNIGKINCYDEEEITTDYISSTGELSSGATVYYVLENPTILEITSAYENTYNSLMNLIGIEVQDGVVDISNLSNGISTSFSIYTDDIIEVPIKYFKEYKFSDEKIKYTRVKFEDGVQNYDIGTKDSNTLYLDAGNLLITSKKQVENIYNSIAGFEIYGFNGSGYIDPAIDIGDIVYIDNKPTIYQGNWSYNGRIKADITSDFEVTTQEEAMSENTANTIKIRKIKSELDQVEGTITIQGEQISDTQREVAELKVGIDEINLSVNEITDLVKKVDSNNGKLTLEKCMTGNLLELEILGNGNVFSNDSLIKVTSNNLIYTKEEDYEQGYIRAGTIGTLVASNYNITTKGFIEFKAKGFHLKVNNDQYRIAAVIFFNESYKIDSYKTYDDTSIEIESDTYQIYRIKVTFYKINTLEDGTEAEITPRDIKEIKPMLSLFSVNEFVENNTQIIDLGINRTLEVYSKVLEDDSIINICDSYLLKDGISQVIRRVGIDENGNKYVLDKEITEYLGELKITLVEETNHIELINYNTYMSAKYIGKNSLTEQFATEIKINSMMNLLSSQIILSVTQELEGLGEEYLERSKIESSIDLGILDDEGYMAFKTNKLTIDSDYFKLTKEGKIIATAGTIGKWTLSEVGLLWSNTTIGSIKYQSGLDGRDNNYLLYAGVDITDGTSHNLSEANAYITKSGLIYAKWFKVNGESGYFYIDYDSGRTSTSIKINGIYWYLDNENNNNWASFFKDSVAQWIGLFDAPIFGIWDAVHEETMFNFYKYNPNSDSGERLGAIASFYSRITCNGYRKDGVNNSIYIQGYEVATNASDERLKENIKPSTDNALEKINNMEIEQFDWRTDKHLAKGGQHVSNGFIAQKVQKIDETLVNYNKENDTYQMEVLNLVALAYKAIQELSDKINRGKDTED